MADCGVFLLTPLGHEWATKPEHRACADDMSRSFAGTVKDGSDGTRTRDLRRDRCARLVAPSFFPTFPSSSRYSGFAANRTVREAPDASQDVARVVSYVSVLCPRAGAYFDNVHLQSDGSPTTALGCRPGSARLAEASQI